VVPAVADLFLTLREIVVAAPALFAPDRRASRAAGERIESLLAASPVGIVASLDRAFRDRRLHRELGARFLEVNLDDLQSIASADRTALWVASLLRNGYIRQFAVGRLASHLDSLSSAFIIHRLSDPVPEVSSAASEILEQRLQPERAESLVCCLPLVDRLQSWERGSDPRLHELEALLQSEEPRCRAALRRAARATDSELRRAACRRLVRVHAGTPAIREALEAALDDRHPRTRRWAASVLFNRKLTPVAVATALLPRLAGDRAPEVRLVALRLRARSTDATRAAAQLAGAAFDANAAVRFFARRFLARRDQRLDLRGRALQILSSETSRVELVGALAALSDLGRVEDIAAVEHFLRDPRPSVAREARRTLGLLRAAEPT
jgi:hypothetical protein